MDYLDFELEIGLGEGHLYPVTVLRSPAGEAREKIEFPFGELELENRLQALQIALLRAGGIRRQTLTPEERAVQDFGRALFEVLFPGEVRSRYDVSRREAMAQNRGLRLKLRLQPPELAALPWEFAYDPRNAEYVCLSRNTPLVRYLELPQPVAPLQAELPLRILGMAVSPPDSPPLDVTAEKRRMEAALDGLCRAGLVTLTWLEGQTWRDLQRAMRHGPWHIFHFIGHGGFDRATDEGFVTLADETGAAQRLSATQLGRLLADHHSLRLAIFNACEGGRGSVQDVFSSAAAILVRRGLPAVLAMQYPITDRAAVEFARVFYEALADGLPVDTATSEARQAISIASRSVEWGVPVLYMRATDGRLFSPQSSILSPQPSVPLVPQPVTHSSQPTTHTPQPTPYGPQPATRTPFDPEMILIPAGEFVMGSDPRGAEFAPADEQPRHTLTLPAYYLAKTPVTNRQYLDFVQATGHHPPVYWADGAFPDGQADHPVVSVSWYDALAYCRWLASVTNRPYTLPSEAEWEKAARGTDGRIYPWGNLWDGKRCNTYENRRNATTPVTAYPLGASPYGVLDMLGNVWEWTRSLWGDGELEPQYKYPYDPTDGRENMEAGVNVRRVLRGGSFNYTRDTARCACRNRLRPDSVAWYVGFRVALLSTDIMSDTLNPA